MLILIFSLVMAMDSSNLENPNVLPVSVNKILREQPITQDMLNNAKDNFTNINNIYQWLRDGIFIALKQSPIAISYSILLDYNNKLNKLSEEAYLQNSDSNLVIQYQLIKKDVDETKTKIQNFVAPGNITQLNLFLNSLELVNKKNFSDIIFLNAFCQDFQPNPLAQPLNEEQKSKVLLQNSLLSALFIKKILEDNRNKIGNTEPSAILNTQSGVTNLPLLSDVLVRINQLMLYIN